MRSVRVAVLLLAWMALAIGGVARAETEEQGWSHLKQYWGRVESVSVGTCGQRPGSCEGTITLMQRHGGEVTLAIRPEMWIKRGDRRVHLEDLRSKPPTHGVTPSSGDARSLAPAAVTDCRRLSKIFVTVGGLCPSPSLLHHTPHAAHGLMPRLFRRGGRARAGDGTEHA
jgi:hypothetical protein